MAVFPVGVAFDWILVFRGLATGADVLPEAGAGIMAPRSPSSCAGASGRALWSGANPAVCRVPMRTEDLECCEAYATALSISSGHIIPAPSEARSNREFPRAAVQAPTLPAPLSRSSRELARRNELPWRPMALLLLELPFTRSFARCL